jgi:cell wall-associated NlpC family hydrolase
MMAEFRHKSSTIPGLVILALVLNGCAAGRGHPPPLPSAFEVVPLIQTARSQLGAPYQAGGSSPGTGFDCSGFTQWVFQQQGIALPRQSFDQYLVGQSVMVEHLQQGDLLFFDVEKKGASHVGIYEAQGWFIHCSSPGGRVREDNLAEKYWRKHFLGARHLPLRKSRVLNYDFEGRAEERSPDR